MTQATPTLEVFLNNEKVFTYVIGDVGPERFKAVYNAIQALWPGSILQYVKEKKHV